MMRGVREGVGGWAASVLIAIVSLVLMVVSIGLSAGQIWSSEAPDLAARFWPVSAAAQAQRASGWILDPGSSSTNRTLAIASARAALARDPTNVVAIRTLGLADDLNGNAAEARRWMSYAESLSRRDIPSELWLIQDSVARGDVSSVLLHYDRALRTSDTTSQLLFPVLISASARPEVADSLSRILARRPNWWGPFVNRLIGEVSDPAVLPVFVRRLKLTPSDADHPDFFGRIMQRLLAADDYPLAGSLYRSVGGDVGRLHHGDFERNDGVTPFTWTLAEDADLDARLAPRPDGLSGTALVIEASNGRAGEVASQVVVLAPGLYILRGEEAAVTNEGGSQVVMRMRCAGPGNADMAILQLPSVGDDPRRFAIPFGVPADCSAVRIGIEASSGLGNDDKRPWLDNLTLTRSTSPEHQP